MAWGWGGCDLQGLRFTATPVYHLCVCERGFRRITNLFTMQLLTTAESGVLVQRDQAEMHLTSHTHVTHSSPCCLFIPRSLPFPRSCRIRVPHQWERFPCPVSQSATRSGSSLVWGTPSNLFIAVAKPYGVRSIYPITYNTYAKFVCCCFTS